MGLLFFIACGAFVAVFILVMEGKKPPYRPDPKSDAQIQAEADAIANANRMHGLAVLLRFSQFVGDDETYQAVMTNTYDGDVPENLGNGSWSSPYTQLLALPIVGINYRNGIKNVIGSAKAKLVADPKNEFDPNAIKVIHESGTHIGFIPADRTDQIRPLLPCYVLCDIEQCEDDLDPTRHYFRGWLYINTQPIDKNA